MSSCLGHPTTEKERAADLAAVPQPIPDVTLLVAANPAAWVLAFAYVGTRVLLIRKKRPWWQAGLLNGVGGKIEEGETPLQAMRREFQEETGVDVPDQHWFEFGRLSWKDEKVDVVLFRTFNVATLDATSTTDERVGWYESSPMPPGCFDNLYWLVPLGIAKTRIVSAVIVEDRTV